MYLLSARVIEQMGADGSREYTPQQVERLKAQTKFTAKEIRDWYYLFNKDYPSGVITREAFTEVTTSMPW